jgi:hypothetical protein
MNDQRTLHRRTLLQTAATTGIAVAFGRTALADDPPARPPAAKPEDVASIDAILAALYDVISGPKGQARDWDRMRSLFVPSACLMVCVPNRDAPPKAALRVFTVEEFIAAATQSSQRQAFYEREVARKTERFGHIAHVFSTYEARTEPGEDAEPIARGINSFQLFWDESRWHVVTIYWDTEAPDRPIPPEYRRKS